MSATHNYASVNVNPKKRGITVSKFNMFRLDITIYVKYNYMAGL